MAVQGNFRMGGIDYSTPSLNNNRDYAPSFMQQPAVDVPAIQNIPTLPSVTNQMSSNRQPGFSVSNDMLQEDMMKEVVKIQLQDLQQNKDVLQNIDAGDGSGRNQYQAEIQDIITKSPLHQEAYLEEYPVGGAFNLAVPELMEGLVKVAVPGLGIGSEILKSFNMEPEINRGYDSLGQQLFIQDRKDNPVISQPPIEDIRDDNMRDFDGGYSGSGGVQNVNQTATVLGGPFSSGLNYAMSIADGSNVPNMIAPSMSYSAANPEGFTQADINAGVVPSPFEIAEPTYSTPDDPSFFGTGIGGVNIPVDRRQDLPLRDILGGAGQEQSKGYQGLNLAGIQRVLDNLS